MAHLETQILLFYYDRPRMVQRFALESICRSTLRQWEVAFIDDSSKQDGKIVLEAFFADRPQYQRYRHQIRLYPTNDAPEAKRMRGEALIGQFANLAMQESAAHLSIMLCDDDALTPDYLLNLSAFYGSRPDINYSYCHLIPYDPSALESLDDIDFQDFHLNQIGLIRPDCAVDSSQVSWRREFFLSAGMLFPSPQTACLDAAVFQQMWQQWGACGWNGLYGQYKGWFSDQLTHRAGTNRFWEISAT